MDLKVIIDESLCIGCSLCNELAKDVFESDSAKGISRVKRGADLTLKNKGLLKEAVISCPVGAIKITDD